MKTIKFTDLEYESMIMMYLDELAEAQEYTEQIKEILKKLQATPAEEDAVEKQQKPGKKRGRKPMSKAVENGEPKKPGRKPKVVVPIV